MEAGSKKGKGAMILRNITEQQVPVVDEVGTLITFIPPFETVEIKEKFDLDSIRSKVYVVEGKLEREFFC